MTVLELAEDANALVPLGPGDERFERDGYTILLGRAGWSCVQKIRLPRGGVAHAVEEVRALLHERGRTPAQWEFGPSATPDDLEQQLVALGFVPDVEPLQTIMVLRRPPDHVPDIEARPAQSAAELAAADEVYAAAFGGAHRADDAEQRWAERTPVRETFVALLDGRIVGAAIATYAPVAVQLNAGAVHPDARGRGVYRALVAARWRAAADRGLDAAVTQAGTMSRDILLRLGFEAHGEIRSYVDTA